MFGGQNGNYSNEMRAAGFREDDENHPRTIYVGNLHQSVTEEFIMTLFGQIGEIVKCKILTIADGAMEPFGFIEFKDHKDAAQALTVMNKRLLLEKEMRVNWATQSPNQTSNAALESYQPGPKVDTSKHFHIFVGDLSPEVDNKQLHDAFIPCGEVSEAKVIRDPQTLKSKGYGFVSFPKKDDAERAIEQMNGAWLGRRSIRTNWASRKGMQTQSSGTSSGVPGGAHINSARYEEIFNQTGPTNTVVYCGGINPTTNDDQIRAAFGVYGNINEVRIFKNQGYAFVRFEAKEQACQAIVAVTGTEINGQTVKCSWGRSGDQAQQGTQMAPNFAQYGYGFGSGSGAPTAPSTQMGGAPGPMSGQPNYNNPQMQQYWQQYYQYYSNPAVMAQWMNYYQGGGGNQNGQ